MGNGWTIGKPDDCDKGSFVRHKMSFPHPIPHPTLASSSPHATQPAAAFRTARLRGRRPPGQLQAGRRRPGRDPHGHQPPDPRAGGTAGPGAVRSPGTQGGADRGGRPALSGAARRFRRLCRHAGAPAAKAPARPGQHLGHQCVHREMAGAAHGQLPRDAPGGGPATAGLGRCGGPALPCRRYRRALRARPLSGPGGRAPVQRPLCARGQSPAGRAGSGRPGPPAADPL